VRESTRPAWADHPDAGCFNHSTTEWQLEDQRYCEISTETGKVLWLGGDPINAAALLSRRRPGQTPDQQCSGGTHAG
jgi:hypothetical protein